MVRPIIHIVLLFLVPLAVARLCFKKDWRRSYLIMAGALLVNVDHVLADPLYDPGRCSIGFHPLHSYPALAAYAVMAAIPRLRILGIGLLIHMALDGIDCVWMKLLS